MTDVLPGEHYCEAHQGNTSHYSEGNCMLCKARQEIKRLQDMLEGRRDNEFAPQRAALNIVLGERDKQRSQWGAEHDKTHDVTDWHTILSVYLGKLGYETPLYQQTGFDKEKAKKRVVQIAAIALAAVEALTEQPRGGQDGG